VILLHLGSGYVNDSSRGTAELSRFGCCRIISAKALAVDQSEDAVALVLNRMDVCGKARGHYEDRVSD
jgi:hypothetical protein